MKKTSKLSLRRESIRSLTSADLHRGVGAGATREFTTPFPPGPPATGPMPIPQPGVPPTPESDPIV